MTVSPTSADRLATTGDRRRFGWALGAITFAGLALRVGYSIAARGRRAPWGDAYTYHYGANALADGLGYIDPLTYNLSGIVRPSAYHPPLYTTYLAAWSVLGASSPLWHRVASSVLGAATVAACGILGRRVAGRSAGLLAAGLAAVYPNLWLNDAALLSESAAALVVVVALIACDQARRDARWWRAAIAGAALAAVALARAELALAILLIGVPAVWGARSRRTVRVAALLGTAAIVLAPWVGANLVRFDEPTTLSTGLGPTLSGGACDETFSGRLLGYWANCPQGIAYQAAVPPVPPAVTQRFVQLARSGRGAEARALLCRYICAALRAEPDESVQDAQARRAALDYIKGRKARFAFVVVPARVGRVWNVFRPLQNARLDDQVEGRGKWPSYLALAGYWILMPFAVVGLVVLRRRREPVSPYLVLAAVVTVGAAVSFGIQRYRIPVDAVLPVLAATGASALAGAWRSRSGTAESALARAPSNASTATPLSTTSPTSAGTRNRHEP